MTSTTGTEAPARAAERQARQAEALERMASVERIANRTVALMCFIPRGRVLFDVDDAVSIAWVAAWQAHRRYDPARGCSWESWVILKIRTALLEAFRSFDHGATQSRRGLQAPGFVPLHLATRGDSNGEPEKLLEQLVDPRDDFEAADTAMDCARTLRVLRRLPPREAYVIERRFCDEATHPEVAEELGVTASRVHQLQRQALGRMREMLGEGVIG